MCSSSDDLIFTLVERKKSDSKKTLFFLRVMMRMGDVLSEKGKKDAHKSLLVDLEKRCCQGDCIQLRRDGRICFFFSFGRREDDDDDVRMREMCCEERGSEKRASCYPHVHQLRYTFFSLTSSLLPSHSLTFSCYPQELVPASESSEGENHMHIQSPLSQMVKGLTPTRCVLRLLNAV